MLQLKETFVIENLNVINEGKSNGNMKIRGIFGRCNEKNSNGRVYPTKVFNEQIKKIKESMSGRRWLGELDHPQNDTVKLANASHLITKLEMRGDEIIGEAEILDTPAGKVAKALIEGGVKVGISSRGTGTLSEDAQGNKIVNEDFNLITFDLVADPSTRGAYPGLHESKQSDLIAESGKQLEKLKQEENFVKLLSTNLGRKFDSLEEATSVRQSTKLSRNSGSVVRRSRKSGESSYFADNDKRSRKINKKVKDDLGKKHAVVDNPKKGVDAQNAAKPRKQPNRHQRRRMGESLYIKFGYTLAEALGVIDTETL